MKKISIYFILSLLLFITPVSYAAYSLSVNRSNTSDLKISTNDGGFIKLSYKKFIALTGQRSTIWNKLSYLILRGKIKQALNKQHSRYLDKLYPSLTGFQRVLFWILIGIFVLIGLFFIIFGFAPR